MAVVEPGVLCLVTVLRVHRSMVVGEVERTEERMAFILVCVVLAQLQIQLLHPVKQSRRPRALYHHQQALKQQQQQQQQHQFKLQVQLAVAPEEQLMEAAGL